MLAVTVLVCAVTMASAAHLPRPPLQLFGDWSAFATVGDECDIDDHHKAHPTNCSQFLMCNHGELIEANCNHGLYWNVEKEACDYPDNVPCYNRQRVVEGERHLLQQQFDDLWSTFHAIGDACEVGNHENNDGLYEPHPTDCSRFLKCNNGVLIEGQCNFGLWWNVEKRACDHRQNVHCEHGVGGGPGVPEGPEGPNGPDVPEGPDGPDGPGGPNGDGGDGIPGGPGGPGGSNNEGGDGGRPGGPGGAGDNNEPGEPGRPGCPDVDRIPGAPCLENEGGDGGGPEVPQGPGGDGGVGEPEGPEPGTSYSVCPAVDPLLYTVILPHPQCQLHYMCVHGRPFERPCPNDLHWNKRLNTCDWPAAAQCIEGAAPEQPNAVRM